MALSAHPILIEKDRMTERPKGRLNSRTYGYLTRTNENKNVYLLMHHGINCTPGYDPYLHKFCSKCGIPGHHEFECGRFRLYNPHKCKVCPTLYHFTSDCALIRELGLNPTDPRAELLALLFLLGNNYKISNTLLVDAQTNDLFCLTKQMDIHNGTVRDKPPKYLLYGHVLYRIFPTTDPNVTKFTLCIPTSLMASVINIILTRLGKQSKSGILKSFMESFFHPMAKQVIRKHLAVLPVLSTTNCP
jgi:hypothetical protein